MKISEVAELTGLDISAVRFYERKGLIAPARAEGSTYRSYTEKDVSRLKQIVLYRKMDLSIETIGQLLEQPKALQDTLKNQESKLIAERERLEGSLDLCRKMIEDQVSDDFDMNYYLNYVKTEEEQGRKYPAIMETLDEIAVHSGIDRFYGFPFFVQIFSNRWLRYLVGAAVFLFLVVFPVVMVIEKALEWRNGEIGPQSMIVWALLLVFYWGTFMRIRHR